MPMYVNIYFQCDECRRTLSCEGPAKKHNPGESLHRFPLPPGWRIEISELNIIGQFITPRATCPGCLEEEKQ